MIELPTKFSIMWDVEILKKLFNFKIFSEKNDVLKLSWLLNVFGVKITSKVCHF